ncbi:hypothetical protein [Achromobacter spanius]|uniref:hypothetical protein n=1 Tax=Achromobacter spanius TaxID=217203 RepID=UPI0037F74A22
MPYYEFVLYGAYQEGRQLALLQCTVHVGSAGDVYEVQEYVMELRDVSCGAREFCVARNEDLAVAFCEHPEDFAQDEFCFACPRTPGFELMTWWSGRGEFDGPVESATDIQTMVEEKIQDMTQNFPRATRVEMGVRRSRWSAVEQPEWEHLHALDAVIVKS